MASLELLCSPPGTGKTSYCIEEFKKELLKSSPKTPASSGGSGIDSRSFFILPSREHADRIQNLILKKDTPGLFNTHILTIHDFASRLLFFSPAAGLRPSHHPTDAVRRGILRSILQDETLTFGYFDKVRNVGGFQDLFLDAVKEFKSNLLSAEEFETRAQALLKDPVFRAKFRDFSIVLKNYDERLREKELSEPEEDIEALIRGKQNRRVAELVIFDGFYHFNRAQSALIRSIARWTRRAIVTLTLPKDAARANAFGYPEKTRVFLVSAGFSEKKGLFTKNHRTGDPALVHLN